MTSRLRAGGEAERGMASACAALRQRGEASSAALPTEQRREEEADAKEKGPTCRRVGENGRAVFGFTKVAVATLLLCFYSSRDLDGMNHQN